MIMESNTIQTASHSVAVDVTKNVENAEKYGKDGMFSTKAQVVAVANQATPVSNTQMPMPPTEIV